MLEWLRLAATCASRSKRARIAALSARFGRSKTLIATSLPSWLSRARYTRPVPARSSRSGGTYRRPAISESSAALNGEGWIRLSAARAPASRRRAHPHSAAARRCRSPRRPGAGRPARHHRRCGSVQPTAHLADDTPVREIAEQLFDLRLVEPEQRVDGKHWRRSSPRPPAVNVTSKRRIHSSA